MKGDLKFTHQISRFHYKSWSKNTSYILAEGLKSYQISDFIG